jgi:hypothetical protein
MTQMRVQITTPYGVETQTFPEDERLIVTNIHGDTFVGEYVLRRLLDQLPTTSSEAATLAAGDPRHDRFRVFGYDYEDVGERESVFALSWITVLLGVTTIEQIIITAAYYDDMDYDLPDGIEFGEQYMYPLASLPFEVVVEDVTGQLYDEVKAGEA